MARRVKDKSDKARFQRLIRNPNMDPNIHRATITVSGSYNSTVAATTASFTMADVRGATDFSSFAALYKTHRVVGFEVQFFDLQPGAPVPAIIGTIHTGNSIPAISASLVQDLPNSTNIVPYKQHYLYWIGKTAYERLFWDVSAGSSNDFGGLLFYSVGGSAVTNKWRFLVRAVVEFKDRI